MGGRAPRHIAIKVTHEITQVKRVQPRGKYDGINKGRGRMESVGLKEVRGSIGGRHLVPAKDSRSPRHSDSIPTDINHSIYPIHKLARARSMLGHSIHGVPTTKDVTVTSGPSSAPGFERADTPVGDGVARQRALVGNPLNDE